MRRGAWAGSASVVASSGIETVDIVCLLGSASDALWVSVGDGSQAFESEADSEEP